MENLSEETKNDVESLLDEYVVKKLDVSEELKALEKSFEDEFNNSNGLLKEIKSSVSNSADELQGQIEEKFDEQNDSCSKNFQKIDEKNAANLKELKESFESKFNNSNDLLQKIKSSVSNSSDEIQSQINDKINTQNNLFSEKFQKFDDKNASDLKTLQKSNLINRILIIAFGVVNLALSAVLFFLKN